MAWLLLLLAGYGGGSLDVDSPSPYVVDDPDPITPSLSLSELESGIGEAVQGLYAYHALPIADAYAAAYAFADGDCPTVYEDDEGNAWWYDSCETAGGAQFEGEAYYAEWTEWEDGTEWQGVEFWGSAAIVTSSGDAFQASGGAYAGWGQNDWGNSMWSGVEGTFTWDGATGQSWLAQGVAPELSMWMEHVPELDGRFLWMNGGVSSLDGAFETIALSDFAIGDDNIGWPCDEPAGSVSVRDDEGQWYDIVFDGNSDEWTFEEGTCDGCGAVWFRGEYLGDACPDFSSLTTWEVSW